MGIQLAKAMGNTVTAISTSPNKKEAAMEIGADNFVVSTSYESMKAAAGSLDLIINTVSAEFDVNLYLQLLVKSQIILILSLNVILGTQRSHCSYWSKPKTSLCKPTWPIIPKPCNCWFLNWRNSNYPGILYLIK